MSNKYIVDVSSYNGNVNWASLQNQGVTGGIAKIIRKDLAKDSQFNNNYTKLHAQKMPWGVYNYSYATNETKAISDMNLVCDILDECNKKYFKYGVWFDIEDAIQAHLSKSKFADIINAAQEAVESRGYTFGVYTGMSYYKAHMDGAGINTKNWWIARYYNGYNQMRLNQDPNAQYKPSNPADICAWQYSSSVVIPATGNGGVGDVSVLYHEPVAKDTKTAAKPTVVKVGSARIDERGRISGGSAGDQTGKEVAIENWYLHSQGWVVLRPKSKGIADMIADAMEAACKNNNIGYDQYQRNTLYNAAKTVGFNPALVKTKCETDCSALVRVCCAYAGINTVDFNTTSERNVLAKTGKFDVLTDTKYTMSSKYLRRGDILVTKTTGHTVVILNDGSSADKTEKVSKIKTSSGAPSKTPKWVGQVTATRLNVRTWAGTENGNIKAYPLLANGNKVDVCDTVNDKDGDPWYYVRIAGKYYGFVSKNYIKKVG